MSGLLRGWLDGEDWPTALTYANACGAFAVSRHGCTPAYPSWDELQFFLKRGIKRQDLRNDPELDQIHWATNRHQDWPSLRIFAFDHRAQLEEMSGATPEKIAAFKTLCLAAAQKVASGPGHGILCDTRYGREALYRAAGTGLWIGRPVEVPGSRPLALEPELGPDLGGLAEWPRDQVVKTLCVAHPDDPEPLWTAQVETLRTLFAACRRQRMEFLLEVIPSQAGDVEAETTAKVIARLYAAGIFPDWWKLEPMRAEAWVATCAAIEAHDQHTRGILVLGLGKSEEALAASFATARAHPLVKGFAVGRTIFAEAAKGWFAGTITDDAAIAQMAERYARLSNLWDKA